MPEPKPEIKAVAKPLTLTEEELQILEQYVLKLSRHDMPGDRYLTVVGALQAVRMRAAKD
jgi:hypothetical protein